MKKIFYCLFLIIGIAQFAKAQSVINGTVKNVQGNPIHFVFIHDQKSINATFTDSLGNFSITPAADATIQFEASGYIDQLLSASQLAANAQVIFKPNDGGAGVILSTASTVIGSKPISSAYLANENISSASVSGGTITGLAHQKGNVHGNRYLFEDFAHGFIITPQDKLVASPTYLYDYDKMGGGVMLSVNSGAVAQVNDDQIKIITLIGNDDKKIVLEKVPALDKDHYVEVLASGSKYSIYKTIKTTFVKADYVNNGVTSHGNDFDEFTDDYTYYVIDAQNQTQKISLKKKALKTAFTKDSDKVNKYLTDHDGDVDDSYLNDLGTYMNN